MAMLQKKAGMWGCGDMSGLGIGGGEGNGAAGRFNSRICIQLKDVGSLIYFMILISMTRHLRPVLKINPSYHN